ncbi:MAG: hypothetical protein MZW92_38265 [Comamonadaceae bacterium]|nr:hypothetical protein [Comamonadaceae bacterium]
MYLIKLILKNALCATSCAPLLTLVGLIVAVVAFGLLQHRRRRLVRRRRGGIRARGWSRATPSRWCSRCR